MCIKGSLIKAMNETSKTTRFRGKQCRLCNGPCEANKRLLDRPFREKFQDIICRWIIAVPSAAEMYHVCNPCQANVEDFYSFKTNSRKVLHGKISSPSSAQTDDNAICELALEALLDNCDEEITLPHETLEDIGFDPPEKEKKVRVRKVNGVVVKPRFKRPARRKTEEEKAMTPKQYRKHYYRMYNSRYKVVCDICGKSLQSDRIEGHMNRHNGLEPFTCEQCGLQFHCKRNMHAHVKRNHVQNDEVTCEICDKILVSKLAHKQHVRTVHWEKKFECTLCGLKISSRHALDQHMDIHNQKRDFVCPQCGKRFYRQYVLNIHLRTHSGETPYTCHICQAAFVHRRIYVMHMQKLHPDEPLMRIDGTRAWKNSIMKKKI